MQAERCNFEQDIFPSFTNALKHNPHRHNAQVHSNILLRTLQLHLLPGSMHWLLLKRLTYSKKIEKNQASSFYFKKLHKVPYETAYKRRHFVFNWDSLHARLSSHCKARSYKEKKHKKIKAYRKHLQKEPTINRCLLILDLKPFRSLVKGKHSIGREFQSLAVRGKKLLTSL